MTENQKLIMELAKQNGLLVTHEEGAKLIDNVYELGFTIDGVQELLEGINNSSLYLDDVLTVIREETIQTLQDTNEDLETRVQELERTLDNAQNDLEPIKTRVKDLKITTLDDTLNEIDSIYSELEDIDLSY
jgi:DNA-binding transcriptional MerR regulator